MDGYVSRTGSSRGYFKQNGEIIAYPHPVMKKSYAGNADAAGKKDINSTMKASFKDPNVKAALTPYHPNAIRNRLPVEFKDAAIPAVRFCHPRNDHTYDIFSGNKEVRAAPLRLTVAGVDALGGGRGCIFGPPLTLFALAISTRRARTQAGYQRFRTTAQNYYAYYPVPVGESNQGIVSEMAKVIHKKQSM